MAGETSRRIRGLHIEFGADTTKFMKALSEAQNKVEKTKKSFKDINKLLKLDSKNIELSNQKIVELGRVIEDSKGKLKALNDIQQEMKSKNISEQSEEFMALRREIIDTEASLKQYYDQLHEMTGSTKVLRDMSEKFEKVGSAISNIGDKVYDVGKKLTTRVTLPLVGVGGAGLKAFMDFESGLIGVEKTTDMTSNELKNLSKQVFDLSKRMPQHATEILKVAESAGQLGIKKENIMEFTETMLQMGQATNLTADESAINFARFSNIMRTPQDEVSRLGSSVVELGNNTATTEAEIVEMAMRIAGAGAQANMTEAEVFGLSATLSSLGLKAEGGGSAISRVIQKMNTAVVSGGDSLDNFAKIAGVSADEFAKKFREKPTEAVALFAEGINKIKEAGGDAISTLADVKINGIRETDAVLRLAQGHKELTKNVEMSTKAYKDDTALKAESDKRNRSLASRIEMLKNRVFELAQNLGEQLLPYAEKIVDKVTEWIDKFKNLDQGTKDNIVKMGLFVAGAGPLLTIIGKVTGGVGRLIKGFGGFFGALADISKIARTTKEMAKIKDIASTTAEAVGGGGKATGLVSSIGTLIGKIGLLKVGLIGAGVALAGIGIYKGIEYLSSSAIPTVDLFGDTVSSSTKEAVQGFLDLEEKSTQSLKQLMWSGAKITEENAQPIKDNISNLTEFITSKMTEEKDKSLQVLQDMFTNSTTLREFDKEALLSRINQQYESQTQIVKGGEERINEILNQAKTQQRELHEFEKNEILSIQEEMRDSGIRTLSESEAEYAVIRQRMKDNSTTLSAQESAEIVQHSLDTKNKTVEQAEAEYDERIKVAEQLKMDGTLHSQALANRIIEEAQKQRDETIRLANEQHNGVIEEAKAQAGEHVKHVDWETGQIKSKWQVFKDDLGVTLNKIGENFSKEWDNLKHNTGILIQNLSKGFEDMKTNISNATTNLINSVSNKFNEWKTTLSNTWDNIKNTASSKWEALKRSITEPVSSAWTTVSGWVDKFKNAFSFNWKLPSFKLPKVKVWTEPGLLGIPIPKFDVKWNRDGGIFRKPTVLPTLNGMQGFAEPSTGGEAILPLNKITGIIADAMDKTKQQAQTIVNYVILDGKVIAKEVTTTVDTQMGRNSRRLAGGLI